MAGKSPRMVVMELLFKVSENAFSNLALDGILSKEEYTTQDRKFISRLFYGVIERQVTLDYIISLYSSIPLHKLDKTVLIILRMGLYQILYMESVPDNAAVNESVNLVKLSRKKSAASFVNAVLRNFIRNDRKIDYPDDTIKRISVMYSCPEELTEKLVVQLGADNATAFLKASLEPHKLYLRVNNTKITTEALLKCFAEQGISAKKNKFDNCCVESESIGSVENNDMFKEGMYHIQDLSSQLCCKALSPCSNDVILDICAAPGGKSFTIAEMTDDKAVIYSCELHKKRVDLIKHGAERLGLKSITPLQNDAKVFNDNFPQFDKILCDVPCSGYGVIRSKPEIKYTALKDVSRLPEIQYDILSTAAKYLRIGGELVYSTCTVIKEENDFVIDKFLENNPNFVGVPFLEEYGKPFGEYKALILAENMDCEGFFISKIKRVK